MKIELDKFLQVSNSLLDFILNNRPKTFKQTTKKTKDNFDFSKKAKNMLAVFAKYIKREDYPWYVISGTFLGLHRERGFLKHDVDIDLGLDFENIKDTINSIDSYRQEYAEMMKEDYNSALSDMRSNQNLLSLMEKFYNDTNEIHSIKASELVDSFGEEVKNSILKHFTTTRGCSGLIQYITDDNPITSKPIPDYP